MKANKIFNFILGAAITLSLGSCFSDPGTDIKIGDSFVEINESTTSAGLDRTRTYTKVVNGQPIKDSIQVNLVGAQRSTPVVVNFAIDPVSTALAGTHYNLITNGTVTIDAKKSLAFIYFNVLDDNILNTETWKVKFNLTSADGGVKLSSNYATFTRTIRVN